MKYPAQTILLRSANTNPYVIFINQNTGDAANKTTGDPAAAEAFAANCMTVGAGITKHTITDFLVVTVPTLDSDIPWLLCLGNSATPAKTDTLTVFKYSPYTNQATDAGYPMGNGKIITRR